MGIELIISNNTIVLGQRKEQSNTPPESHAHERKKGAFKGRERRGRDLYPTSALEAAAFPLKMIREKFIRALCPSNMHRLCQVGGLALPCFVSSLFSSRGFGEKQPVGFFWSFIVADAINLECISRLYIVCLHIYIE